MSATPTPRGRARGRGRAAASRMPWRFSADCAFVTFMESSFDDGFAQKTPNLIMMTQAIIKAWLWAVLKTRTGNGECGWQSATRGDHRHGVGIAPGAVVWSWPGSAAAGRIGPAPLARCHVEGMAAKVAGTVPTLAEDSEGGWDPDTAATPKDQRKMDRFIPSHWGRRNRPWPRRGGNLQTRSRKRARPPSLPRASADSAPLPRPYAPPTRAGRSACRRSPCHRFWSIWRQAMCRFAMVERPRRCAGDGLCRQRAGDWRRCADDPMWRSGCGGVRWNRGRHRPCEPGRLCCSQSLVHGLCRPPPRKPRAPLMPRAMAL